MFDVSKGSRPTENHWPRGVFLEPAPFRIHSDQFLPLQPQSHLPIVRLLVSQVPSSIPDASFSSLGQLGKLSSLPPTLLTDTSLCRHKLNLNLPYPAWEEPRKTPVPRGRLGQAGFAVACAHAHADTHASVGGPPPLLSASHLLPRTGSPRPG